MDNKYNTLLWRITPDASTKVADGVIIAYTPSTGGVMEYRAGDALPQPNAGDIYYKVSGDAFRPAFAVFDAIACAHPDPQKPTVYPGFSFSFQMSYTSPIGLAALLMKQQELPDCITLEQFYLSLQDKITDTAKTVAGKFSGGHILPYAHWWTDLTKGTKFRDALEAALYRLFFLHGFRLESNSLKILGLAGVPLE